MTLSAADFDFALPPERIAQSPASPRDAARLLSVTGKLADHTIAELPGLLRPGDLLVVNDTRVIPAQLTAHRGQARIGITLDRKLPDGTWHALARNARRAARPATRWTFDRGGRAARRWVERQREEGGAVALRFNHAGSEAFARASATSAGALALAALHRPAAPGRPRPGRRATTRPCSRVQAGARGRPDGRPAFHTRACWTALSARAGWTRASRDAACRRRHLPADARGRCRPPST